MSEWASEFKSLKSLSAIGSIAKHWCPQNSTIMCVCLFVRLFIRMLYVAGCMFMCMLMCMFICMFSHALSVHSSHSLYVYVVFMPPFVCVCTRVCMLLCMFMYVYVYSMFMCIFMYVYGDALVSTEVARLSSRGAGVQSLSGTHAAQTLGGQGESQGQGQGVLGFG